VRLLDLRSRHSDFDDILETIMPTICEQLASLSLELNIQKWGTLKAFRTEERDTLKISRIEFLFTEIRICQNIVSLTMPPFHQLNPSDFLRTCTRLQRFNFLRYGSEMVSKYRDLAKFLRYCPLKELHFTPPPLVRILASKPSAPTLRIQ
jgi:hypothetical protein